MAGWIAVLLMGVLATWMFVAANCPPRPVRVSQAAGVRRAATGRSLRAALRTVGDRTGSGADIPDQQQVAA